MFAITETDFKEKISVILKQHILCAGLGNKKDAALDLAKYMEKNKSGSFIDDTGHTFDPSQAERRKGELPSAFYRSATKVISEAYDDLDMYFFARHVLGQKDQVDNEYLARVCLAATPVGHYGKTLGSLKDVCERLSSTKDLYTDSEGGRYVLISMSASEQVTVAPMHVSKDGGQLSLPTFSTEHFKGGEKTRQIDGFMMEADKYIFTIARDAKKLRIAKLVTHARTQVYDSSEERMDLIGIRLGGFDPHTLPNAHRIYGYQLRDRERFEKIRSNIEKNGSERKYAAEFQSNEGAITTEKVFEGSSEVEILTYWLNQQFEIDRIVAQNIAKYILAETAVPGNLNTPDPSSNE